MAGSFAQTCNRLSQFLKKGGSFGDINNLFEPISTSSSQMTIFYGGQVIVLDGFPSDKAMEIMDAAKSASLATFNQPEPASAAVVGSSSDLPIARKASLRRFLEKRKDRVATRAPYQMNKPAAGHSWIDLEAQPLKHHLELRL